MSAIDLGELRDAMTRTGQDGRVWREWQAPGREPGLATLRVVIPIVGVTNGPAFDAVWLGVALAQYPGLQVGYDFGISIAQACTVRGKVAPTQFRRLQRVSGAVLSGDRETVLREVTAIARASDSGGARTLHGLRWVVDVAHVLSGNREQLRRVTARWAWELGRPRSRAQSDQDLDAAQDNPAEDLGQGTDTLEEALRGG